MKMGRRWRISRVLGAALLATMLLPVTGGWAREGPYYETSLATRMTRKLVRGSANVAFGWCEIPRNIHYKIEDLDPFTGTIAGFVRGSKQAIVRTSWGVWEVVTFPFPIPSEYRNMVEPEFVWQDLFE